MEMIHFALDRYFVASFSMSLRIPFLSLDIYLVAGLKIGNNLVLRETFSLNFIIILR